MNLLHFGGAENAGQDIAGQENDGQTSTGPDIVGQNNDGQEKHHA